jgi:hypothetical protein
MRDYRALANFRNLDSYRAWQKEGLQRSGFVAFALLVPLSVVMFSVFMPLIETATRDARSVVVLAGGALAIYLLVIGGLGLVLVLRLNAWKRAHPWSPPS